MNEICRELYSLLAGFREIHGKSPSHQNLLHYTELRRHDFTFVQDCLFRLGLSSLARSYTHTGYAVERAIRNLERLEAISTDQKTEHSGFLDPETANEIIIRNNTRFFGGPPRSDLKKQRTHIMLTLPSESTEDEGFFIKEMMSEHIDLFRINTAHDAPETWKKMASYIQEENGRTEPDYRVRIFTDLAGPKIRTVIDKKSLRIKSGDTVWIYRNKTEKEIPDVFDDDHKSGKIHKIGCTFPEALSKVQVNDRIFFDDGKIASVTTAVRPEGILCSVTAASKDDCKLKDNKGINFPDSHIDIPGFTEEDRITASEVLPFTDIIGISFTQGPEDIKELAAFLEKNNRKDIAIAAKIETMYGVRNLPKILEALIDYGNSGLMIARGDLAIEAGFENLPYLQEEILDICSAAHIPVILATQVLETAMKSNIPSRSEVIDAGMAGRADCIMLNKGTYAKQTVRSLKSILLSMHRLFSKKRNLMDKVDLWE